MSNITFKSENEILGEMLRTVLAGTGANDINPGSVLTTILSAVARQDFAQYYQLLQVTKNYDLDNTTGTDLDSRAFQFGLKRLAAQNAGGQINILMPSTFSKKSTNLFSGFRAPIAADTTIYVNSAANFGTSGTVVIGRGTANEEQATFSIAPVNNTTYWSITFTTGLLKSHTIQESIILIQGSNTTIPAGTYVQVPATTKNAAVTFQTIQDATILAGEEEIDGVNVTALAPGAIGNIPTNAINGTAAFPSPPFVGARALNPISFVTGADRETDTQLRNRIRSFIQGLSQATFGGITYAIKGLTDATTSTRVVSSNIISPLVAGDPVQVYIDTGNGFEPTFNQVGQDPILPSALGLETRLQLGNFPVVKAFVETINAEPYNFSTNNLTLQLEVGNQSETVTFDNTLFLNSSAALANEVVAQINNQSALVEARTTSNGSSIVVTSLSDINDNIQVLGGTANAASILNFPTNLVNTFYLYKNDKLLSKDGLTAYIDSAAGPYDFSSGTTTLSITVDNKTANTQTVTFLTGDFATPSNALLSEIVAVINDQLAGATAVVINNNKIRIISNTANSSTSAVQAHASTANTILGFITTLVSGADQDYVLNEETGTIGLVDPLEQYDLITAGTANTRAFLTASIAENYSITSGQTLVIVVDGGSPQTITFATHTNDLASTVADDINSQLVGGLAVTRTQGADTYLEIRTNDYNYLTGSIVITSGTANTALGFELNSTITTVPAHTATLTSASTATYAFATTSSLAFIIDNNPSSNTLVIPMSFNGTVTSGSSTTVFADTDFTSSFITDDLINDYQVAFSSGSNTTTGVANTVTLVSGSTYQYAFDVAPTNFSDFAAGDMFTVSSMQNIENNGTFLITAISTSGPYYVRVSNLNGTPESASTGSALIGQRRQISSYTTSTGAITVSSAFRATPASSDTFAILPYTKANLVSYLNNIHVTSLSLQSEISLAYQATLIQIASLSSGSDGYLQISGDAVNTNTGLTFVETSVRGNQAYAYYTGLTKVVHKTIYGDETDLASYPGVGAEGVRFQIKAPITIQVELVIGVTLSPGLSLSTVQNSIINQTISYVNSLGVGQSVILSNIVQTILSGVAGIEDVMITFPTGNVQISANEIAKTNGTLITVDELI